MPVPAQLIPRQWIIQRNVPREKLAEQIRVFVSALDLDKPWRVVVQSAKSTRSDLQNRYLFGYCYKTIGDAIGYETEEVHEFILGTYYGWKEKKVPKKPSNPLGIESVPIRTTTTDETGVRSVLTKMQFAGFVAFVQRFAASKGIHLNDPDPEYAEHREKEATV
ncbi:MAG: hypothetical protein RB191_01585 [Terriglobia bacterium]|nr:hypothetical protein [Terriglobia bacterium]